MSDVYKVGMEIALTGGLQSALAGIMGQLTGMHGKVKEIEKGLAGWNKALIGVGAIAIGAGILDAAGHIEKAGEKLAHAKTMLSLGKSPLDMAKLTAAAWKETGANLRSDITGNVEALQDLYNVLMNTDEAIAGLGGFNLMKNALDSASGKGAQIGDAASGRNIGDAIRAFELEGRTSKAQLLKMSDEFTKAILALPGRITGTLYNTQVANSGSARMGWSDDFATHGVPALMNVLKQKTGTSLNALGNNIADGLSSSVQQMDEQILYGLQQNANRLDPKKKKPGFKPGTAFEADVLRRDPIQWSTDYLANLKGQGVDIADKNAMMTVVASIARGNKLLKAALDELLLPASHAQILKEYQRIGGMPDNMVGDINAKDPEAVRQALAKQWETTLQGFGEQLSITLIPALQEATKILSAMNLWIGQHPIRTRIIADAIAISGALMVLGGALAILRAVAVGSGVASIARLAAGGSASAVAGGAAAGAAGSSAGWLGAFLRGPALAVAALHYEDEIKSLLINPLLEHIVGAHGTTASLSDIRAGVWGNAASAMDSRAADNRWNSREGAFESSRGKALSALPPPVVNITNQFTVTNNVTLDKQAIGSAVTSIVLKDNRVINSAAQSDGADRFKMPEMP